MTEFKTKSGRLTRYALACGYLEDAWVGETHAQLWMEHGVIHVRAFDHAKCREVMWKSWRTVTEARRDFDRTLRAIKKGAI